MNENKVIKLWQWMVLLLVLCNIGLMLTIWLKPVAGSNVPRSETPRDYIVRSLKFSGEQTRQYDILVKDHQQAMHRLRHEAVELHNRLFNNLKTGDTSNVAADSLAGLIANNQREIDMVTYRHFLLVRALCTDTQKREFDNIIVDIMRKMGGPHGGPPPPRDGEGPPPPDGPPNP
jgi:periplasmic protein CpxP/Spy